MSVLKEAEFGEQSWVGRDDGTSENITVPSDIFSLCCEERTSAAIFSRLVGIKTNEAVHNNFDRQKI